eukprot:5796934-Pleurochrysis_carterae.AAC.3
MSNAEWSMYELYKYDARDYVYEIFRSFLSTMSDRTVGRSVRSRQSRLGSTLSRGMSPEFKCTAEQLRHTNSRYGGVEQRGAVSLMNKWAPRPDRAWRRRAPGSAPAAAYRYSVMG